MFKVLIEIVQVKMMEEMVEVDWQHQQESAEEQLEAQ